VPLAVLERRLRQRSTHVVLLCDSQGQQQSGGGGQGDKKDDKVFSCVL